MKRLAVFLVVTLGVLLGCMGGGGGGGGIAGSSDTLGHISGKLTLQAGLASIHASSTKSLASVQPGDAVVFLEENPSITAIPAADGSYRIDGIPFGSYFVLVRVRSPGGITYKVRSVGPAVVSSSVPATQVNLSVGPADVADRKARLLVYSPNGQAAANCIVTMWGEPFDPLGNGIYSSPYMPSAGSGNIFIEPPLGTSWERGVLTIPAGTFRSDSLVVIGVGLVPAGSTNHPPVVQLAAPLHPTDGNGALILTATALDQDGDSLTTSWSASGGSFSTVASYAATWIAPADAASATITFKATEISGSGPYLTSKAQLVIYVSPPGGAEVPGEITLFAPRKLAEISGTATAQIAGNTLTEFIASITWPSDVTPAVSWTASKGTPTSSSGTSFSWRSPAISAGEQDTAVIGLVVQDSSTRVERSLSILISSLPLVQITAPAATQFETGTTVAFRGDATDFQGMAIPVASLTWYLATGASPLQALATGSRDFSYGFTARGEYRICLRAVDRNNMVATATKSIAITNARPIASILSPANQSGFQEQVAVLFQGSAFDLEDGAITANGSFGWSSSIDGFLASGTSVTHSNLSAGAHVITLAVLDSEGSLGSASITVRINLPPAMDFAPADSAAFFSGRQIAFLGVGTDTDGLPILPAGMNWFLDDEVAPWRQGTSSFSIPDTDFTAGTHRVRLEGTGSLSTTGSSTHLFTVGVAHASILSPADEARIDLGTPVTLTATPSSVGLLTMEWWENWGLPGAERIGQDTPLTHTFPIGRHQITYRGMDGQGFISSDTVAVVVETLPQMAFTPASGSVFFAGSTIPFHGIGTDSDDLSPMPAARMTWYIDSRGATPWYAGIDSFDLETGTETPGTRRVTLSGLSLLGVATGTAFSDITIEHPLPEVTSPASGTTFDPGELMTLTGAPAADGLIPMQWWLDYDTPGRRLLGTTTSVSTDTLPAGWHYLSYMGTDTAGTGKRDDIMVLIQDKPVMTIDLASGSWLFNGELTLTGSGIEAGSGLPVDDATLEWYKDLNHAAVWQTGPAPLIASGSISGWHRIELNGVDSSGIVGTKMVGLHFNVPQASIIWPASGTWYTTADTLVATGSPDSVGSITMRWWLDYGRAGETLLGSGYSLNVPTAGLQGWHYLTYIGTDSMNRLSSSEIMILVQDRPAVAITPADGTCLFGGNGISLTGMGTESVTLASLDPDTMSWYLDGAFWKSGSPNTVAAAEVATGIHQVGLVAVDSYGIASAATSTIYFGYSLPQITSPASGTQYGGGSNISFSAVPPSTSTITMRWYDGGASFASGDSTTYAPPLGLRTISYSGRDGTGRGATHSIQILVDDVPSVALAWANGTAIQDGDIVFGGHAYSLIGAGTQSTNLPVPSANLKWYLDGNPVAWKTGSTVNLASGDLATGSHQIVVTATDEYGLASSVTRSIYVGYPLADISAPASGTRVDTAVDTTFTAVPDSSGTALVMNWYWDGTNSLGTGESVTANTIASGWRAITYIGTDSTGFNSFSRIDLLVNRLPVATITISAPSQYATGTSLVPIYLASEGTPIQISVTASDYEYGTVPAASITWFWPSLSDNKGTGYAKSFNVAVQGTQTAVLQIMDNFGSIGTATCVWWVWDAESYTAGMNRPTGIGAIGPLAMFVADASGSRVMKFARDNGPGLTTSGDLLFASATSAVTSSLINLHVEGDTVYSLETDVDMANTSRIQVFNLDLLVKPPAAYSYQFGNGVASLSRPTALLTDNLAIYIADSGNGKIVKYDINNNNYGSANTADFTVPFALRKHPTLELMVASDLGSQKGTVINSSLNFEQRFDNASNAADIAYGSGGSPNIYISDNTNNRIIVLDAAGNLLFTFGTPGGGFGQFNGPWGLTIVANDLYVVEHGGNRIQRFRGGSW